MPITLEYLERKRQDLLKGLDKVQQTVLVTHGAIQLIDILIAEAKTLEPPPPEES